MQSEHGELDVFEVVRHGMLERLLQACSWRSRALELCDMAISAYEELSWMEPGTGYYADTLVVLRKVREMLKREGREASGTGMLAAF